jgi:hypothetical protein
MRAAIVAYLREGLPSDALPALTDYLCVDTPSILDDAGFTDAEADRAVEIFDEIAATIAKKYDEEHFGA